MKLIAHVVAWVDVEIDADDMAAAKVIAAQIKPTSWELPASGREVRSHIHSSVTCWDDNNGAGFQAAYEPAPAFPRWFGGVAA